MATLDPNIILGGRKDIYGDAQKYKANNQNLKDAVLGNEINQYKLKQAQDADTRTNNLREIFSQNSEDMLPGALKAGGYIDEYNAFNKQKQGQAADQLKNQETQFKIAKQKIDLTGQAMGGLMNNPTVENLQSTLEGLVQNGVMKPEEAQAAFEKGPKDPAGIKQLATQHYTSALDTKEQLEKFSTQNNGQTNDTIGVNPVTGATRTVNSAPILESANNVANNQRMIAENEKNRQVQMRGQDMTSRTAANRLNATSSTNTDGTPQYSTKPLPATALKMQNEGLEALSLASNIDKDLASIQDQMNSGKLKLGMLNQAEGYIRNKTNNSNENSRNLASFKTTVEKLRNDSLKLNKGVQTEGDAQRIWNEILGNIDDQAYVQQRLGEIRTINQRAVELHKLNVENIRSNYNAEPIDYSRYENQPAAVGSNKSIIPKGAKMLAKGIKTADDFLKAKGL